MDFNINSTPTMRANDWHVIAARTRATLVDELGRRNFRSDLYDRLIRCGEVGDNGRRYRCRTISCPTCRSGYVGRQRNELEERFHDADNRDLGMLTVVPGALDDLDGIPAFIGKFRWDLRNRVDALRRRDPSWHSFGMVGWLDLDLFTPEDVAVMGPGRRELLAHLSLDCNSSMIVLPHFHFVYRQGGDIAPTRLTAGLAETWDAPRQVHAVGFDTDRTKARNISGVVNYALRMDPTTDAYGKKLPWPAWWTARVHETLHTMSDGFKSLKVKINPKKETIAPKAQQKVDDLLSSLRAGRPAPSVEPMPIVF